MMKGANFFVPFIILGQMMICPYNNYILEIFSIILVSAS